MVDIFSELRKKAENPPESPADYQDNKLIQEDQTPKKELAVPQPSDAVDAMSITPHEAVMTIKQMKEALPAHLRVGVTRDFADKFNRIVTDSVFAETVRDNFISYNSVLADGRFKIQDYLNAVVYVSHKLANKSNQDAYIATFPDRYNDLIAAGKEKHLSAYVAQYAAGKLPNLVLEQSMIPIHVLNQDIRQKAINRLAHLMSTAQSEFVQANAATALLTHLKAPEKAAQLNINIETKTDLGMSALHDQLAELAEKNIQVLESRGVSAADLAKMPLFVKSDDIEDIE